VGEVPWKGTVENLLTWGDVDGGTLRAMDKDFGKQLWWKDHSFAGFCSSPRLFLGE